MRIACALLFACVSACLCACLCGCMQSGSPQLIQVLDVAPRQAELGDRFEIIGAGFPQGRPAFVAFRGTLRRPGERPIDGVEINATGVVLGPQQVEIAMSEELLARFCGVADKAAHTTFEGEIEVAFSAATAGAPPVAATLYKVSIDVRPPSPRPDVVAKRDAEGKRALDYMGIGISPIAPPSGGLLIGKVAPGSRADQSGIADGDVLERFDGVRVAGLSDAIPSRGAQSVIIGVRRGTDPREHVRQVSIDGFRSAAPRELVTGALVLLVTAAFIVVFFAPPSRARAWIDRRIAARMRATLRTNEKGASLATTLPTLALEAARRVIAPAVTAPRSAMRFAPHAAFLGLAALFVVMPFRQYLLTANLDVAILFIVAVTSLLTTALLTGGWSSAPKYSVLAALRSALQVVSFALPAAIAVACIVMMTGSLRVQEIIRAQGGWPWDWYVFRSPVTLALFVVFFGGALADRPGASSTLSEAEATGKPAARDVELASDRTRLFTAVEWVATFAMCGIGAAAFLGGWQVPGVGAGQAEAHGMLQLVGSAIFLAKSLALLGVVAWLRWAVPRVGMERMFALSWKWLVPIALVSFALTAAWVRWSPGRGVQAILSIALFAIALLVGASFVRRLHHHFARARGEAHLNPFL